MVCNVRSIVLVLVILTVCKEYTTCHMGYYLQGTMCTQCPGHCTSCSSAIFCTRCTTGYNLINLLCCPQACSACSAHNYCTSCKHGYFMDQGQCKQCSDRCASCDENNMCYRCKSGYREMAGNCYMCQDDCVTCIDDNKCSSCRSSDYYVHNHSCVKCSENCVSCTSNTECTNCTKGFYSTSQCLQECSASCTDRDCELNGQCKACVDGMYGDNCDVKCGQHCTSCDRNTGGCSSCEASTYLNNYKCERCPTSCTQCTSISSCTECVVGYWGGHCEKECTKCKPETRCRKDDGYCENSCVDGMYGYWCNKPCTSQCLSCRRSSYYKCTACVANKYGYNSRHSYYTCNTVCPQNCFYSICDDDKGECTLGCINGYHGNKCTCPQNCNCNNWGECSSCKEGYGNVNQNCECTEENCVGNDCSACTGLNYFVQDKTCCSCGVQDTNCEECTTHVNGRFGRCTKCNTGFFPPSNQIYCTKCPINCKDSTCDAITGECTLGCKAGHWDTTCDDNCAYCSECYQHNGTCTVCRQGKYSAKCSNSCSPTCKTIDHVLRCAINDGACIDGCQSTKVHGSHCQHSCSINCTDEQCDWQTAHCLHGCTDHHYGNVCNNTCSQTCSTPKTGSRCYHTNGTCVDGCELGYYGEMCENQCSPNCLNTTCEQFTGSCQNGCREHYEGNDCMMALSQAGGLTGTIAGGVGGLIVLCPIVLLIVTLIRRRRHHKDEAGSPQEVVMYDISHGVDADDDENNYNIEERNDDIEEVVYEQIDDGKDVQPGHTCTIVVDSVPQNEDNAKDKTEANVGDEYEQTDGEGILQEKFVDEDYITMDGATGQGSGYEQLKPRNTEETNYSGLAVQDVDNITDTSYENIKIN